MDQSGTKLTWRDGVVATFAVLPLFGLAVKTIALMSNEIPYDFEVFWEAGYQLRTGDVSLYSWAQDGEGKIFLYPPFFAALFAPISLMGVETAYRVWVALQLPLIVLCLIGLFRLSGAKDWRARLFVAAAVMTPLYMAFHKNLEGGQVNVVTLLFTTWALVCALRGRAILGGLGLSAGAQFKVMPVALVPVLVIQRRWRTPIAMGIFGVLLALAPMLWLAPRYGIGAGFEQSVQLNLDYVNTVAGPRAASRDAEDVGTVKETNLSISANLERANRAMDETLPVGLMRWGGALIALAMYVLACLLAHRCRDRERAAVTLGLALTAALLAQLTFWNHHVVLLALMMAPFGMLVYRRRVPGWTLIAVGLSLFVLFGLTRTDRLPGLALLRTAGSGLFGILAAWLLVAWATWRASEGNKDPGPHQEHASAEG